MATTEASGRTEDEAEIGKGQDLLFLPTLMPWTKEVPAQACLQQLLHSSGFRGHVHMKSQGQQEDLLLVPILSLQSPLDATQRSLGEGEHFPGILILERGPFHKGWLSCYLPLLDLRTLISPLCSRI